MSERQLKKVPIQERAVLVGDTIAMNGFHANRVKLKQRFAEGGYQGHETPRFLVFTRAEAPKMVIVHHFPPEEIDADLGSFMTQELKSLGLLTSPQDFGDLFGAVVGSLFPGENQRAWHLYATSTLRRYHVLLANVEHPSSALSNMEAFAIQYRRVFALMVGESLLDAGCSFGFFPLLAAERFPHLSRVVGVDIQESSFAIVRAIAEERHLSNVHFTHADLLSDDLGVPEPFDTVTALHVLEHFSESEMYRVLDNLLRVTAKRLLLGVPYEQEPEGIYEHRQVFTRARLEAVGQWCLRQWGGAGTTECEDCAGGLLVLTRIQ